MRNNGIVLLTYNRKKDLKHSRADSSTPWRLWTGSDIEILKEIQKLKELEKLLLITPQQIIKKLGRMNRRLLDDCEE